MFEKRILNIYSVFGFPLTVKVSAVNIINYRYWKILDFQLQDGLCPQFFIGNNIGFFYAFRNQRPCAADRGKINCLIFLHRVQRRLCPLSFPDHPL